jgi:hypothetical protein
MSGDMNVQSPYVIIDKDEHKRLTRDVLSALTKREYFAACALQGLCANGAMRLLLNQPGADAVVADRAVEIADALIEALKK